MVNSPAVKPVTLTHEDAVARAAELVPLLARNAAASAQLRHIHPDNIQALRAAGLFSLLQPRRLHGAELTLRALHETVSTLTRGCASTAWVFMVLGVHTWISGMFSETCQDEIYADDPDMLIAGTLAPQGRATAVAGGWRVSGRWQFGSGCDHASWSLIGATQSTSTPTEQRHVHVLVPRREYAIDDTWHVLGLRATGSKDLVLEDVFVPDHCAVATGTLFGGKSEWAARHATNLYRTPVVPGLALAVSAPVLGLARQTLELFVARLRVRSDVHTGAQKAQNVGMQLRIAESSAEITSAELLLKQVCDEFDRLAASGARADVPTRARLKWQAAYASALCRRAVERLFAAAGAHAIYDLSELQTLFRDINTATHHATIDFDSAAEIYGRVTLGLNPGSPLL